MTSEVDGSILELYTNLLSSPLPTSPLDKIAVTYTLPLSPFSGRTLGPSITILESPSLISGNGTTGLRTWEASLALAEWLILSRMHSVYKSVSTAQGHLIDVMLENENVLELGAGTGLVSLVASALGARRVLATDGDEGVCDSLEKNVHINGMAQRINVEQLFWGSGRFSHGDVTLVLGADVIYDKDAISLLVSQIKRILSGNSHTKVVLSSALRNEETFAAFKEHVFENNLVLSEFVWPTIQPPIFYYDRSTPVIIMKVSQL